MPRNDAVPPARAQLPAPPISIVIVTKNEERRIEDCLRSVEGFDDIWVIDSNSADKTREIATKMGAQTKNFDWNGQYPKKRGWCLENLKLKYDWVFFLDADECAHPFLIDELRMIDFAARKNTAGFFIKGQYVLGGQALRYGLHNHKIALFHTDRMAFPIIDDLDIPGMGEIEGHYQPTLKPGYERFKIEKLHYPVLHYAFENLEKWEARHKKYARWEAGMNAKNAWPKDPKPMRQFAKTLFRHVPFRGHIAYWHSLIWKRGALDGQAGRFMAQSRKRYYEMISIASKAPEKPNETATSPLETP